ncbi:MAG: hypothetical protein K2M44_01430 [Clostridia bacterium]|nr:hypothetical protein [Clostridia bacterium]
MNQAGRDLLINLDKSLTGFNYAVLDLSDITQGLDLSDVGEAIDMLTSGGFIIVKYRDEDQICLCITRAGRTLAARLKADVDSGIDRGDTDSGEQQIAALPASREKKGWDKIKNVVISAVVGLFGGVIGGAIIYLIMGAVA